jgi:ABC-type sugar transport system substrate-binding protein
MLAMLAAIVVAGSVAGCGGDEESSTQAGGGGGGGAAAEGGGIEPRTIGVVDIIAQSPIDRAMDDAMIEAGKQIGWDVKISDAGGNPQNVVQMMQAFVTQRVDAIILISVEANLVRNQIRAAKAANIPVIEIGAGVRPSELWDAQFGEDETRITEVLADYIFEHDPDAKIANLTVTAISNGLVRDTALKNAVKEQGNAEIVASAPVDLTNPVVSTENAVAAMLTANPDTSAVHSVYDNFLQATIKTITNKRNDAKAYSYFTAPDTVKALRGDTPLQAVADVDLATTGMIAFDQLVAHFESDAAIDRNAGEAHQLQYVIVSKENVEKLLGDKPSLFPTEEVVEPFVTRWKQEYGG